MNAKAKKRSPKKELESFKVDTKTTTTNVMPLSDTALMIQTMEKLALSPDVDVEKMAVAMERMLVVQEKILDRNDRQEFAFDLAKVQGLLPIVPATGFNQQTNSKHAKLDVINKLCMPIINSGGFNVSLGTDKSELDHHIGVTIKVTHKNGYSQSERYDSPIDDKGIKGTTNKTPTHARSSGLAYGHRYLIKMFFNIIVTNEDIDGNNPIETITEDQSSELHAMIKENNLPMEKFVKWLKSKLKVESIVNISANDFKKAKKVIQETINIKESKDKNDNSQL